MFKFVSGSQGGGRSSARETIGRVAAGAVAKKILKQYAGTEVSLQAVVGMRNLHFWMIMIIIVLMVLVPLSYLSQMSVLSTGHSHI